MPGCLDAWMLGCLDSWTPGCRVPDYLRRLPGVLLGSPIHLLMDFRLSSNGA
ncbi:hypothetical protein M433DRAFT_158907 [Acidomyces richmondensis BFW]|nr:hypothetical protein M433DRAFT_158907 [Acidomyces richmondensis BFW]